MISQLKNGKKVVGFKQTKKAVQTGRAKCVFLACDADPVVTEPLSALCAAAEIPVERDASMRELGQVCGISVGAAAVALLED